MAVELANYIANDDSERESLAEHVEQGHDPLEHICGIADKVLEVYNEESD